MCLYDPSKTLKSWKSNIISWQTRHPWNHQLWYLRRRSESCKIRFTKHYAHWYKIITMHLYDISATMKSLNKSVVKRSDVEHMQVINVEDARTFLKAIRKVPNQFFTKNYYNYTQIHAKALEDDSKPLKSENKNNKKNKWNKANATTWKS